MKCSTCQGAFSREYLIKFLCYNQEGELIEESAAIYQDHVDTKAGLSRVDLLEIRNQIAEIKVVENGTFAHSRFKIPLKNLVRILR